MTRGTQIHKSLGVKWRGPGDTSAIGGVEGEFWASGSHRCQGDAILWDVNTGRWRAGAQHRLGVWRPALCEEHRGNEMKTCTQEGHTPCSTGPGGGRGAVSLHREEAESAPRKPGRYDRREATETGRSRGTASAQNCHRSCSTGSWSATRCTRYHSVRSTMGHPSVKSGVTLQHE